MKREEKSYTGSNWGSAGGGMLGSMLGAGSGALGAGALAMKKTHDPKKAALMAMLGAIGGRAVGDAAGGAAGAGAFAPEGEGGSQAMGYGAGSLAGTAGVAAGGGALMLALRKNPALLAKLGGSPGARMKNLAAALPFGAIVGGVTGLKKAQRDE